VLSVGRRIFDEDEFFHFFEVSAIVVNVSKETKDRACLEAISEVHDIQEKGTVTKSPEPRRAVEIHSQAPRIVQGIVPDFTDQAVALTFSTDQ